MYCILRYSHPAGDTTKGNPTDENQRNSTNEFLGIPSVTSLIVPFVGCGDLRNAYDSDKSYPLELHVPPAVAVDASMSPPVDTQSTEVSVEDNTAEGQVLRRTLVMVIILITPLV